jgi:hypothetical protein
MSDDEVRNYVEKHAPELDPDEVDEFMTEHEKPTSEPGTPLEWATALLRRRKADRVEEGPSLDIVEQEMRRHDERQE